MYRRGGFGRGWGGPYMRRGGFPLLGMGGFGMGMGGFGGGGSLLGDLVAGGFGYLMGRQSAQQYQAPQYQAPQYQPPSQAPQYQAPAASGANEKLAQLKLLGQLRASGTLSDDEFEAEKQKILQGY